MAKYNLVNQTRCVGKVGTVNVWVLGSFSHISGKEKTEKMESMEWNLI